MKYILEYRDREKSVALSREIAKVAGQVPMTFMEVCGTHTMSIARFGLSQLLPPSIRLISGPGCPVCVTPNRFLDHAIALSRQNGVVICTFGDMMRVPGSSSSLEKEHALGRDIRIVYSSLDALNIAKKNPELEIVFLGIGFETTAPTIAASILNAKQEGMKNYSVLCAHKAVVPALEALVASGIKLDGFILPGHVSTIIGVRSYRRLFSGRDLCGVIAGFEPTDVLGAILNMAGAVTHKKFELGNSYPRAVSENGNLRAMNFINRVFELCDSNWRGLGEIGQSGFKIREELAEFDASKKFSVCVEKTREPAGCRCGEILSGIAPPFECPLFGHACTPDHPVGPCMVSSEGTCQAYYKYNQ